MCEKDSYDHFVQIIRIVIFIPGFSYILPMGITVSKDKCVRRIHMIMLFRLSG